MPHGVPRHGLQQLEPDDVFQDQGRGRAGRLAARRLAAPVFRKDWIECFLQSRSSLLCSVCLLICPHCRKARPLQAPRRRSAHSKLAAAGEIMAGTPRPDRPAQWRRGLPARARHEGAAALLPAPVLQPRAALRGEQLARLQGWRDELDELETQREMRARERRIRSGSGVKWRLHVLRKMKTSTKFAKSRKRVEISCFERIRTSSVIF